MIEWLATRGLLGLAKGWWLLIAVALLVIAALAGNRLVDLAVETAKDAGATAQREADLRETLDRTEEAHAARDEVRQSGSAAAYNQCLRTARTPANCQRFLPGR